VKLPAHPTLSGKRKGSFTLFPTLSRKRKRSFTLTPTLSPQGRGSLQGRYPRREREIRGMICYGRPEMTNKFPRIIRPKRYQKKGGLQRVKIVSILTKREGWVYKFHFKMDSKPM